MTPEAINILLVEDSPVDALLLRTALEDAHRMNFAMVHAERLSEAISQLQQARFDVVVLDMGLPDSWGLEGLRQLRGAYPDMPILLLTGIDDEEVAIAAMQEGAQDYLVKARMEGQGLTRAIRYAIERKRGETLQRAKVAAEEANDAKDHFLAVLSHELRTPLTPVLTTASMLEADQQLPANLREDIAMIRRNVELEARLIDDLLDVTRIARGKLELRKEQVQLCDVVRRAVEVCKPDIIARRLEFGVDIGPEAPYVVEADAARLLQVFWNLLKNAIKFTPHGGCVGIRCRKVEGYVDAEVNDSGVGMEPAALGRIFNAFEQGDRSVTRHFGGLGLGLAISRAIVELHGGTVTATSPGRNQGSTFHVRLPLVLNPFPEVLTPATAAAGCPSASPAQVLSILLVEDHGDTAKIMMRLLRREGHEVYWAGDLETSVEVLKRRRFDLLISDLGLPDGSGHDLMRQIRANGQQMPGIALSGYGREEDIHESHAVGFARHLTKPIDPARLLAAVAEVAAATPVSIARP
jgi:signal transduction histidine kinase